MLHANGVMRQCLSRSSDIVQARNMPVVVLNAITAAHGWAPSLSWSEGALKAAVGHAQIRVRSTLQQNGVVSYLPRLCDVGGQPPRNMRTACFPASRVLMQPFCVVEA